MMKRRNEITGGTEVEVKYTNRNWVLGDLGDKRTKK